jgi:hypothetical protein
MKRLVQALSPAIAIIAVLACSCPAWAGDPTMADCLSANESSISLRTEHKLRAARAALLVCAATSCPAEIRNECIRRVADINAAVPTIVFEAKDASGNDIGAVKVTMDGQPLVERLEGMAISLDPGEHSFTFETSGQAAVQKQFVIHEAEKERRERITFGAAAPPPPEAGKAPFEPVAQPPSDGGKASTAPAASGTAAGAREEPSEPSRGSTKRIVGFVLGGVGVVALGVAVFEQITALGRDSDSKNAAASQDPNVWSTIKPIHDQAIQAQTYAIVSGLVGAAAVGVGTYLVVTSFGASRPAAAKRWRVLPQIGTVSGVALERSW